MILRLSNVDADLLSAQVFWPILHEKSFQDDLEAVYNGDTDIFKTFVVRMVIATSLQKLEDQYAGLADSYYLAAMQDFEAILRPKDLKTLQCLALIGHYSMITPTRVPVYFVLGLAAKICQQEGLVDEKTITAGYDLNPLTIDMRRRLVWTIASMEYGLAHSLGRPNSFATADEQLDVGFFATVDDEYITENGIGPGPTSDRKLVAVHLAKMRILQAEIRRTLYERKKVEPRGDGSPWFKQMEAKLKEWLDGTPESPPWAKSWYVCCVLASLSSFHLSNIHPSCLGSLGAITKCAYRCTGLRPRFPSRHLELPKSASKARGSLLTSQ